MNGIEQRERHSAFTRLNQKVDELAAVLEADLKIAEDNITAERAARLKFAAEERQVMVGNCLMLADRLRDFKMMSFWQRVKWLLFGATEG